MIDEDATWSKFSEIIESLPTDEFLANIKDPKLAGNYRIKLSENSKRIRVEFRKNKKAVKEDLQQEISIYETHDELVNMIILRSCKKVALPEWDTD